MVIGKKMIFLFIAAFAVQATMGQTRTRSGLDPERFDSVMDGKKTGLYTLVNRLGVEACVTNYGGRLVSLVYRYRDMVLGFDNVGDYRRYRQNFGATVGRYTGRIFGARFSLDGQTYQLQGSGGNISHGGYPGFADRVWDVIGQTDSALALRYMSPDGENGFPGTMTVDLTYRLRCRIVASAGRRMIEVPALEVNYEVKTDKPTVVNLTNHSFFNISGHHNEPITSETLYVNSDEIAVFDSKKNLDGTFMNVEGTPFDFRRPRMIGQRIDDDHAQLKVTGGYDHSFMIRTNGTQEKLAARVFDPASGTCLTVYTTEPAVHIYTSNGLKGNLKGKDGIKYPRRSAICLETMHLADAPNHPNFPSTVVRPGEVYRSQTTFVWSDFVMDK